VKILHLAYDEQYDTYYSLIYKDTAVPDLMKYIKDIENLDYMAPKFQHPQYIEGTLYITPQQYKALIDVDNDLSGPLRPPLYGDIPVVVMRHEPIPLPSGNILYYSAALTAIIIHKSTPAALTSDYSFPPFV
jgi:hypothetical protein